MTSLPLERLTAALSATPCTLEELGAQLSVADSVPDRTALQRQLQSLPGLRIDCTTATSPVYSRVWTTNPDAARTASTGLWRSFALGNNAYPAPYALTKCVHDAEDVSAALASKGHAVTLLLNAGRDQVLQAFEAFVASLAPACTVVMFFSGHGLAVGGHNYLVPVDFDAGDVEGVRKKTPYPCSPTHIIVFAAMVGVDEHPAVWLCRAVVAMHE